VGNAPRIAGPILLVLLVAAVVYAIFLSNGQARRQAAQDAANRQIVTVKGLVGSEKLEYLQDPQVVAELRAKGIDLQVESVGSREMAGRSDLKTYDFAFPAGVPGATKVMQVTGVKKSFSPFFTPMVVASWTTIANILIANGIVKKTPDRYDIIDMKALLDAVKANRRWTDLK